MRYLIIITLLLVGLETIAQPVIAPPKLNATVRNGTPGALTSDTLVFHQTYHHFGKIKPSEPVEHDFQFTNKGDDTIRIINVQSSCGCTVPLFTRDQIPPGGTGVITLRYDAKRMGGFKKHATVFWTGKPAIQLFIAGTVVPPSDIPKANTHKVKPVKKVEEIEKVEEEDEVFKGSIFGVGNE